MIATPVAGFASAATSGTPRLGSGWPLTLTLFWYEGVGNSKLSPPPLPPPLNVAQPVHAVSDATEPFEFRFSVVPPTAVTSGLVAAKSATF